MRMQAICVAVTASLFACGLSLAAGEINSGPKVGTKIPGPFHVLTVIHVEKPDLAGKKWDYVEQYGSDPVVLVIARTGSDPLTKLLKRVDAEVARYKTHNKKVHALLVMLSNDGDLEEKLKDLEPIPKPIDAIMTVGPFSKVSQLTMYWFWDRLLAEKQALKHVSLSIGTPAAGPAGWRIAKDADVTVLLYNRLKIEGNHAFGKGELNDKAIDTVVDDLPKILVK